MNRLERTGVHGNACMYPISRPIQLSIYKADIRQQSSGGYHVFSDKNAQQSGCCILRVRKSSCMLIARTSVLAGRNIQLCHTCIRTFSLLNLEAESAASQPRTVFKGVGCL